MNDLVKPLLDVDFSKFLSSLELALDLGFELARLDRCHLVFTAWNASSKLCGWDSKVWSGSMSVADFNGCGNALKLFHFRNDICQIHWEFDDDEKFVPDSFLTTLLKEKKRRGDLTMKASYLNRIGFLMKGLPESLKMLEDLNKNVSDLGHTQISSGDFTTIKATLAYTSFFISMFTKSNSNFIFSILRRVRKCGRKRKGSSISADSLDEGAMEDDVSDDSGESESGCPDDFEDEDDAEAKLDGISRLHDVCTLIGAAPLHPDWLDTNCQLRQRYRSPRQRVWLRARFRPSRTLVCCLWPNVRALCNELSLHRVNKKIKPTRWTSLWRFLPPSSQEFRTVTMTIRLTWCWRS